MENIHTMFWTRLHTFVSNVQTNDIAGEEEKEFILATCNKQLDFAVSFKERYKKYRDGKSEEETISTTKGIC